MTKPIIDTLKEQMNRHVQGITDLYEMYETARANEDERLADAVCREAKEVGYNIMVRSEWQRNAEEFELGELRIILSGYGPYIKIEGEDSRCIRMFGVWSGEEHWRDLSLSECEAICWLVRVYMPELDGIL